MLAGTAIDRETAESAPPLVLTEGGPGARVLRRLGLAKPGRGRAVVVLAAVTWLPLLVLSAAEGSFLRDLSVHVRLLVALPVLVLAEAPIGASLGHAIAQFVEADLVPLHERRRFAAIVADSARLRDSRVAEVGVLALAGLATYVLLTRVNLPRAPAWFTPAADGKLSTAGMWYAAVSLPLLQFVVYRWLYLLAVWARLLRRLSRLDLRLTPAHPDCAGGLGFLGECSVPLGLILFAASAIFAGEDAGRTVFAGAGLEVFQLGYLALFVVALAVLLGPLLVFVPTLLRLRRRGLLVYGALASEYARRFEQKWIEGGGAGDSLLGTPDIQSLADLGGAYDRVQRLFAVPIARRDLLATLLPGLVPLLLLAASTVSAREVARSLLRLIV